MTTPSAGEPDGSLEDMSALADGEVGSVVADAVIAQWNEREELRHAWHAYQVIGDTLRSDELAAGCASDRDFLSRMRTRLQHEPVPLAPQALQPSAAVQARVRLRRWAAPLGIAAGVTLVVSTLFVTRVGPPVEQGSSLARSGPAMQSEPRVAEVLVAASVPSIESGARAAGPPVVLRDPHLDRYLAAHKQYQGANALGPTPGFIRSATYDMATR